MPRNRTFRQPWRWVILGVLILALLGALAQHYWHDAVRLLQRASLPSEVTYTEVQQEARLPTALPLASPTVTASATPVTPAPTAAAVPASVGLPVAVNLAVPFTAQAPHGIWDEPYAELCEEASVFMAMSYINSTAIPSPEFADQELLKIKDFEDRYFGYYKDTTTAETATIIREHYGYSQVTLLDNPTAQQLREALAAGKLVIVPAAGRLLGNPYFTGAGPLYHMLVLKGYTADGKFITNDPGTRRGADFLYDEATIMNAMHDWRSDGQILNGKKVVLIVG